MGSVQELHELLPIAHARSSIYSATREANTKTGVVASRHGLLQVGAAGCEPDGRIKLEECRTEMPMLERLHREFSDDGLSVLGVNFREDIGTIERYAKQLDLTFPLLLDPYGSIQASYGVSEPILEVARRIAEKK